MALEWLENPDRFFYLDTGRAFGMVIVIIDDVYMRVAKNQLMSSDDRFIERVAVKLLQNDSVCRIVLSGFDFEPEWLPDLPNAVFFVDLLVGSEEVRGRAVFDLLRAMHVGVDQIAVLTKNTEWAERVFADLPRPPKLILKLSTEHGRGQWRIDDLDDVIEGHVIPFVQGVSKDPYVGAVRLWGDLPDALRKWPPDNRRLFPDKPPEHHASWWLVNGQKEEHKESVNFGNHLISRMLSTLR